MAKLDCYAALSGAYSDWLRLPYTGLNQREHQRFGQYVWNRFEWDRESWPELFYEEDEYQAYMMLYEACVAEEAAK